MNNMRPSRYLLLVIGALILFCGGFALLNYGANDFGLWRHRDSVRIWSLEKTSKYLLAGRYVPENFDGVMIGPSLSDTLDTRDLHKYKIYNLSMAGGNITELSAAATAFLSVKTAPKIFVLCLNPYITVNNGFKSFQIDPSEKTGSLFSIIPAAVWIAKLRDYAGAADAFHDSSWGLNDMNVRRGDLHLQDWVAAEKKELTNLQAGVPMSESRAHYADIDPVAKQQLDALLKSVRKSGAHVVAFYYPVLGSTQDILSYTGQWKAYQAAMAPLFKPGEIVLDMSGPHFASFRNDLSNYRDPSHLTRQGSKFVIETLDKKL